MDPEISVVELTDAAVPAVVELCRIALDLAEDAAEAQAIVTRLRGRRTREGASGTTPTRVPAFVAFEGGTAVGVVTGSLGSQNSSAGHVDLVAVHPERRRRGIGRALVSRIEATLAGLGATEFRLSGNPPHYAWPGVDVRYTPAVCAATAWGYTHEQTAWNMTADLSAPDSPALRDTTDAERRLAARGVIVRRATPEDVPALVEFARSAFGPVWGDELADSVGRPDAGCHLALRTESPESGAGSGAGSDAGSDAEVVGFAAYGSSRPSWFGPMGTAPGGTRGLGIGGILLRRCLRDQRAAGHRRVQIGWVGPVPFYSAVAGARIERVFFLFHRAAPGASHDSAPGAVPAG